MTPTPAMQMTLTRQYNLSAQHNLYSSDLSLEENRAFYGDCFRRHGHDFQIQITVLGEMRQPSGLAFSREQIDSIVHEVLIRPYQGTYLNDHFPHPSGEGLCRDFYTLLKKSLPLLEAVSIQETRKNWFSYSI